MNGVIDSFESNIVSITQRRGLQVPNWLRATLLKRAMITDNSWRLDLVFMNFHVHPFFPLRFLPFSLENTKDNKHHIRKHSHFYKMVLKTMCIALLRPVGSWPLDSLSITFFGDKERETSIVVRKRCKVHRCTFHSPLVLPL